MSRSPQMTDSRPVTSRPRGVCKYYSSPTGCLAGRTCKFLHGDEKITPYDKAKTCKFFAAGFCKRGTDCWFVHEQQSQPRSGSQQQDIVEDQSEDDPCCICFEKPTTYGLLGGCSHIFCVGCIREWRELAGKTEDVVSSGVTKKCPMCRAPSQFVTPSSHFFTQDHPQKAVVIEQYRTSMSRVPCKYFEKSNKTYCPFGKDCFYQHLKSDGTQHSFRHGVNKSIRDRRYHELRRRLRTGEPSSSRTSNDVSPDNFDAIVASLRELAVSVAEATTRVSARANYATNIQTEDPELEAWLQPPTLADTDADAAIARLADNIISSLLSVSREHTGTGPSVADFRDELELQLGVESSLLAHPGPFTPGQDMPVEPATNDTPAEDVGVENLHPSTSRPSSALSVPARFSTSVPGRTPSPLGVAANMDIAVPWTRSNREPTIADSTDLLAGGRATSGEENAVHPPVPGSSGSVPPSDLTNEAGNIPTHDTVTAAAVHDTDPPFMTDGRGRVVWSSATASSRPRRGRTATANPAVSSAGDSTKPQGRESSQTNSPVVRPASLARRETDTRNV